MSEEATQTIVLGVTGGIGAYKACEIVRSLTRSGFRTKVAMTEAAARFVGPLTFRTLSGQPVAMSLWDDAPADPVHHVSLAQEASVLVVAPCTANVLAKLAHGRADDLLTTTALATEAPLIVAPAMNDRMWLDPATQENADTLRDRGVVFVGPGTGSLACGDEGIGRLADPELIVEAVIAEARRVVSLEGVSLLVTAGGTREPLDPVRFLGNRSTGHMGFAIAEEAARRGAEVTVVAGATTAATPYGCEVVRVETAAEMFKQVMDRVGDVGIVVMSAAVADYRPASVAEGKIKKGEGDLQIALERTEDILAALGSVAGDRVIVGFAAETEDIIENAREKLRRKGCDLIVANDVSGGGGFGPGPSRAVFVTKDSVEETGVLDKSGIARALVDRMERLIKYDKEM